MGKDCTPFLNELVRCLSNSECVKNHPDRKTALRDCSMSDRGDVPKRCHDLIETYRKCWHTNIDPRRRIRGQPRFDGMLPPEKFYYEEDEDD